MKYAIEYLPSAPEDLKEIVRYIARTLQNPKAAENLAHEIIRFNFEFSKTRNFPTVSFTN